MGVTQDLMMYLLIKIGNERRGAIFFLMGLDLIPGFFIHPYSLDRWVYNM